MLDFNKIKMLAFDVDGVMTDGGIILQDSGLESKVFHSRDGLALRLLIDSGLKIALITGRTGQTLQIRAKSLGIDEVHQGVKNKKLVYEDILLRHQLTPEEFAYAGDDLIDLPILTRCALPMAPADACPEVLARALFISKNAAGHGAVREMVEFILKGQGKWQAIVESYL